MDPECCDNGCNCKGAPTYDGLSQADVRMIEEAATNPQTYCRNEIIRPDDDEIKAYQDAHPEVDWTKNEVLYRWNGFGQPMTVESYWSHEDRDAIYAALTADGFDPKWFEKTQEAQ